MKTILLILPFLISFFNGLCIVTLILGDEIRSHKLLHFSLAGGLGLGLSGFVGYFNFLVLDRYNPNFQITINLIILGLAFLGLLLSPKQEAAAMEANKQKWWWEISYLALFLVLFAPIYYIASFYPYGGWDSWAVWHFKSRFMLLSGDAWRNMFDPLLWRSSPHYPLLLPLINVWGWTFVKEPTFYGPMITSILYTLLSLTLLVSSLMPFKKDKFAFLGSCLLISSPFYGRTAISQYADIFLGYYLLAALVCIVYSVLRKKKRFALLGGIFTGLLSFSKPEGLAAALIVLGIATAYYLIYARTSSFKGVIPFGVGSAMAMILPLTFYLFITPENMTMANGLVSKSDPSTWLRFKTILAYSLVEFLSIKKWKGLWVLIFILVLANLKRCFSKEIALIPAVLASYGLLVGLYYLINTRFEILWWMGVSLDRILGSLIPVFLWWVIYAYNWKRT